MKYPKLAAIGLYLLLGSVYGDGDEPNDEYNQNSVTYINNNCVPEIVINALRQVNKKFYVISNGVDVYIPDDGTKTSQIVLTSEKVPEGDCIADLDLYVDIFHHWRNGVCVTHLPTTQGQGGGGGGGGGVCTEWSDPDGGIVDLAVFLKLTDPEQTVLTAEILQNECVRDPQDTSVMELYSDEGLGEAVLNIDPDAQCAGSIKVPKKPAGDLGKFDGEPLIGTWSLDVSDNVPSSLRTQGGKIQCWALIVVAKPCEDPDDKIGKSFGDPHFMTWNGDYFDFHGACDLAFMNNPGFAGGTGMWIQIRTQIRQSYSYIESAAIKIGEDILEVGAYGSYMVNGVSNAEMPTMLDEYTVHYQKISEKLSHFDIDLGNGKSIVIKTIKDLVSVSVEGASKDEFGQSRGLLGRFRDGARVGRNGTVIEDVNDYAQEWQVLESEENLFQVTNRFPQHPVQCVMPRPMSESRRLGETLARHTAEKACEHWEEYYEQCVFDVMATGDLDLASAWAM